MSEGGTMNHKKLRNSARFIFLALCLAGTIFTANWSIKVYDNSVGTAVDNQVSFDILFSVSEPNNIGTISQCNNNKYEIVDVCELFSEDKKNEKITYYSAVVNYNKGYEIKDIISEMNSSGCFNSVEEDTKLYANMIPNVDTDPYMSYEWYLDAIGAKDAWSMLSDKPGEGIVVAVIDTGVNYNHGDIKKNMWVNEAEAYGIQGYDDDRNGVIDDIYGANFTLENSSKILGVDGTLGSGTGDPNDNDSDGHGTHVAGTIAMSAANGGGCGIAYGAKIMAVKAGKANGSFSLSNVVSALNYAVDNGAEVINMSFGTYYESAVLKAALKKAAEKCVLVAAAGNDGIPTTDSTQDDAKSVYPASYPFVIGVMASDQNNNVTTWSNYDYEPCTDSEYEIAAPGYNIFSTVLNSKYNYMSGTSMAAPVVSAAAAVILGSIDRSKITDPVKYVYGQLTQATTHTASRKDSSGLVHTYPELNLYDALSKSPGISLRVGSNTFYDQNSNTGFKNELSIDKDKKAKIYCGYKLNNLWGKVDDITVTLSTSSKECSVSESSIHIDSMEACSSIDIACDNYESLSFDFTGEPGGTYTIPLTYTVSVNMSNNVTFKKAYTKTITIKVLNAATVTASQQPVVSDAVQNAVQSQTDGDVKTVKPVAAVSSSNGSVGIRWSEIKGATGYYVYRSASAKGKYSRIAVLAASNKTSYTDKGAVAGRKYYYKLRAYTDSGATGDYSNIVYITVPAIVKGLSCDVKPGNNKINVVIKWKKSKGAKKYVVYASYKKKTGYRKIAVTKKITCTYTTTERKACYFRIRAYAGSSNGNVFGKYSVPIKIRL